MHETINNLQERAFMIKGPKDTIESLSSQGRVLDRSSFMGDHSVTLYVDEDQLQTFHIPANCTRQKIPLQQLMVYLTNHKEESFT